MKRGKGRDRWIRISIAHIKLKVMYLSKRIVTTVVFVLFLFGAISSQTIQREYPDHEVGSLEEIGFNSTGIGYAAGKCDVLLVSRDGGEHWVQKSLPASRLEMYKSVLILEDSAGFLFASGTQIYASSDYGDHWAEVNPDIDISGVGLFRDMLLTPGGKIWILGTHGILQSADNGVHWKVLDGPGTYDYHRLLRSDTGRLLWLYNTENQLFNTEDEGGNWSLASRSDYPIRDIGVVDDSVVFRLTNVLSKSTDGGRTWKDFNIYTPYDKLFVYSPLDIYVFGDEISYFSTFNGGKEWYYQATSSEHGIFIMNQMDSYDGHIFAATRGNAIMREEAFNYPWDTTSSRPLASKYTKALGLTNGVVFYSDNGVFTYSIDNGANWNTRKTGHHINDMVERSDGQLLIASENLTAFDGKDFRKWRNTRSFYTLFYRVPNSPKIIAFVDGFHNYLFVSEDDGEHWKQDTFIGASTASHGIYGYGERIIAACFEPIPWLSLDGGRHWGKLADVIKVGFDPAYIKFLNENQCICVQADRVSYWDISAGRSFRPEFKIDRLAKAIDYWFVNSDVALVLGGFYDRRNHIREQLRVTTDGGKTWHVFGPFCDRPASLYYDEERHVAYVGTNGESIYSIDLHEIVGSRDVDKNRTGQSTLLLTPNPNDGVFTMKGVSVSQLHGASISIFNLQGQNVWHTVLRDNSGVLHLPERMAPGIYWVVLRLHSGQAGKVMTAKMVLMP